MYNLDPQSSVFADDPGVGRWLGGHFVAVLSVLPLLLLSLATGCDGSDRREADPALTDPLASALIVADDGGTVSVPASHASAGTSIEIPPGALAADTTIHINSATTSSLSGAVGFVVDIGPDGTQFAPPATITLTYDVTLLPAGAIAADMVIMVVEADGSLTPLSNISVDVASNTVSGETPHLSEVVPFLLCPDTDGDGVCNLVDACPGFDDTADEDGDGTADGCDDCESDPAKTAPGVCGCGLADTDSDGDGTPDCVDLCPGFDDSADADGDGTPDGCDMPDAPTTVSAAAGDGQVLVDWSAVDDASAYNLYWNTSGNVTTFDNQIVAISETSFLHTGLTNDTTYYYIVTAVNAAGEGVPSTQVSSMPMLPGSKPTRQWTRQNGTAVADTGQGAAVDSLGNVYVAGFTFGDLDGSGNSGQSDIHITKYDAQGNRDWTVQPGTSVSDAANGIAVDASGNVFVTGNTSGFLDGEEPIGAGDFLITKYDAEGGRQWTVLNGTTASEVAHDIELDSAGNIYLTGTSSGDVSTRKFDKDGNHIWTTTMGTGGDAGGRGVAVDVAGNVYVVGQTDGDLDGNTSHGGIDIFITKHAPNGDPLWTVQPGTAAQDIGFGIAVDSAGNVYATGYTLGGLDGNSNLGQGSPDIVVTKYDTEGTRQWTRQTGSPSTDNGAEVALDSAGDLYVTGRVSGPLDGNTHKGSGDIFVSKYDASGNLQWTLQPGSAFSEHANDIALDSAGNIYLTGNSNGDLHGNVNEGGGDFFVIKYGAGDGLFTVGGDMRGLSGTVVLQNQGGDDFEVTTNGPFTFPTAVPDGTTFRVRVLTDPVGQSCNVVNGDGQIAGTDFSGTVVTCNDNAPGPFTVGGGAIDVRGGLVLQINGGEILEIIDNGPFTFPTGLADGTDYEVRILVQPEGGLCYFMEDSDSDVLLGDGSVVSGTIAGADVTDIIIKCYGD